MARSAFVLAITSFAFDWLSQKDGEAASFSRSAKFFFLPATSKIASHFFETSLCHVQLVFKLFKHQIFSRVKAHQCSRLSGTLNQKDWVGPIFLRCCASDNLRSKQTKPTPPYGHPSRGGDWESRVSVRVRVRERALGPNGFLLNFYTYSYTLLSSSGDGAQETPELCGRAGSPAYPIPLLGGFTLKVHPAGSP